MSEAKSLNQQSNRILLIEYDPASRSMVREALDGSDPAFHIDEAADHAALQAHLIGTRHFDLIITGLNLNGLDSGELIEKITRVQPGVPIVLLTHPNETSTASTLLKTLEVADYVLKTQDHLRMLPVIVQTALDHAAATRAAREAELRFMRMAENAPDMIFRWSYAQGFEYVNPASTEVVGYTPEEHYADPGLVYRVIHPDDIPAYESVFSDWTTPEGARRYVVIRWFHKDGHVVHVEMRMSPIFDDRGELVAIEGIARDISQHVIARERLRELTMRLTDAQEEERRRLARDLHDDVGQALTIMKMRLRMAQNAISESEPAREKLDVLGTLIEDTLKTIRALSHELRPPLLDELGWDAALSWLCDSFSQRSGLPVSYKSVGECTRLDTNIELVAYRVVQEALTNIARHADAADAAVSANQSRDKLLIAIQDSGKGFDMQALQRSNKSGLGLLSMQERVDTVGGEIAITSTVGAGTLITATLPIHNEKDTL